MTQPTSGLLPALIGYYRRLVDDPNQSVADVGFSVEKIHFCIVLEPDGKLFDFQDIRERNDRGKPFPRSLLVPDGGGRSGTGLKPFFCWDNTGYALGRDNKGKPDRAADMFAAFRDLHLSFRDELAGDEGFSALCRFLERWEPARAEQLPNWEEAAGLNVVFKLRARERYIHQSEAVRSAWSRRAAAQGGDEANVAGVSLVDGEEGDLARLHPQLGGVAGANTSGAALVSFNLDAFESYGKSQSFNAPVGTRDAFRYTTALNRLLADDARRVRIGDATVVFWSDRPEGGGRRGGCSSKFSATCTKEEARGGRGDGRSRPVVPGRRAARAPLGSHPGSAGPVLRPRPLAQRGPSERALLAHWHGARVRQATNRAYRATGDDRSSTRGPATRYPPPAPGDRPGIEGHRAATGRRGRPVGALRAAVPAVTLQRGRAPGPRRLRHEPSPGGNPESLSHPQSRKGGARGTQQGPSR